MSPRYTPLSHEDSDEESSPEEHLLSTSSINSRHAYSPSACSATLSPALVLRLASLIMGTIAFIIFIVDGDIPFIAADIFLAFIMILDFSMIVNHAISDVFQITIYLRNGSWKSDVRGSEKLDAAWYIDILLSTCLLVSLIVGNAIHYAGIWIVAVIFGYFIMWVMLERFADFADAWTELLTLCLPFLPSTRTASPLQYPPKAPNRERSVRQR